MPRVRVCACASNGMQLPVGAKNFRVRRMRPEEASRVASLWKEALLLPGLTSYGRVQNEAQNADLESRMADQMRGLSLRRNQARQVVVDDRAAAVVAAVKAADEAAAAAEAEAAAAAVLLPGGGPFQLADVKPAALLQVLADKVPTMVKSSPEPEAPTQPLTNPHRTARLRRYRLWTCLVAVAETGNSTSKTLATLPVTTAATISHQPQQPTAVALTLLPPPAAAPPQAPQWLWGSPGNTPINDTAPMISKSQQGLQQQQQEQPMSSLSPVLTFTTTTTCPTTAEHQVNHASLLPSQATSTQQEQVQQSTQQLLLHQNSAQQHNEPKSQSASDTSNPPPHPSQSSSEIIGYIVLSMQQPQAMFPPPWPTNAPYQLYVDGFAVSPSRRRQGVGQALLAAAEKLSLRQGLDQVWLSVDESNSSALRMYRSTGFTEAGQGEFRFRWGGDIGVLMRKALPKRERKQEGKTGQGRGVGGGGIRGRDGRSVGVGEKAIEEGSVGYMDGKGVWVWKQEQSKEIVK